MKEKALNLQLALDWLEGILADRLRIYTGQADQIDFQPLSLYSENTWLSEFIRLYNPSYDEFAVLLLALAPHLKPGFFRDIVAQYLPDGGDLPEFGAVKGINHRDLLPTGETAQFILAGDDLKKRLAVQHMLSNEHWFAQNHILRLESLREGEPVMSGRLILDPEIIEMLTLGAVHKPRFSLDFPAQYIETEMVWDDLVLHPNTWRQIREIEHWIRYNDTLLYDWGMKKKIKPGYRALFYGPPGTGKTLTATLLGKHTGKDVYRIDLSNVVSKYIGETEKNLSKLFDKAENKNWILFFDEADALFGKRTEIRDAHDKYANQEVSYLLQRIENYNGLVILASNQRANIDDAFIRRFQSVIYFPMPRPEERHEIWCKMFPPQVECIEEIDWYQIAARYELTGAGILNVVHFCAIELLACQSNKLDLKLLESAIQRELIKEGKIV